MKLTTENFHKFINKSCRVVFWDIRTGQPSEWFFVEKVIFSGKQSIFNLIKVEGFWINSNHYTTFYVHEDWDWEIDQATTTAFVLED